MKSLRQKFRESDFCATFHFRDEMGAGRSYLLMNSFMATIANVLSTGVFYTGYLAANGIDIVSVSVISLAPYIAWFFGIFSPAILRHFKSRRYLLLFNHLFYYTTITLGTTVIPMLTKSNDTRIFWFIVCILAGNISNALLGSGCTPWHANFYPEKVRSSFFSYQQLIAAGSNIVSLLISCFITDRLAGSPQQLTILTILRFVAYAIYCISGMILFLRAKEFPYKYSKKTNLADVFRIPIKNKLFMMTAVINVVWQFNSNINSATWNYYLIDTAGFSFLVISTQTIAYCLSAFLVMKYWRRAINRFSWTPVMIFTFIFTALVEFGDAFTTKYTPNVFIIVSIVQGFNCVGLSLSYSNLFYLCLPEKDQDQYIVFWNVAANVGALLGLAFGTWYFVFMSKFETTIFGLPFSASQYLTTTKGVIFGLITLYLGLIYKKIDPRFREDAELMNK